MTDWSKLLLKHYMRIKHLLYILSSLANKRNPYTCTIFPGQSFISVNYQLLHIDMLSIGLSGIHAKYM